MFQIEFSRISRIFFNVSFLQINGQGRINSHAKLFFFWETSTRGIFFASLFWGDNNLSQRRHLFLPKKQKKIHVKMPSL